MVSPVLTNSCRPEINGKNLPTHSRVVVRTNGPSFVPGKVQSPRSSSSYFLTSQSNKGSDEAESDGDNPLVDNAEEGNGNVEEGNDGGEELGDDYTEAEESGDKESVVEQSNEQVRDSNPATTPKA
ncbi:hypothetical protein HAX54_037662, partial [Datura stramonium]|nr:hypothetical protein [Datura stramonium]